MSERNKERKAHDEIRALVQNIADETGLKICNVRISWSASSQSGMKLFVEEVELDTITRWK